MEYEYRDKMKLHKLSIGMLRTQILKRGGSYDQDMGKESLVNRLWTYRKGKVLTITFQG